MKFFYSALIALTGTALPAAAQSLNQQGCATVTTPAEIQRIYDFVQHQPDAYAFKGAADPVDTLPLTIHIVGKNDGSGYYAPDKLLRVLCKLNEHYAPAHLYFAVQWPIRYINNTSYYDHSSYVGQTMMLSNNVPNTINIYFVKDPAGACGYFSPWADGVAIAQPCADPNSTTLVHELGHFLGLPHTFYGWEGGTPPLNPEKVTRGAGANCNTAGDGFCDTDADWQAARWYCPYSGTETDPDGVPYQPDSSLYMGYAVDACMSRFSNMQIAAMHYNVNTARASLYPGPFSHYQELTAPGIAHPADTMYQNDQTVRWHPTPGANQYRVTVSPRISPLMNRMEVITADTFLAIDFAMIPGNSYRVRVEPMSSVNVCRENALVHEYAFLNEEAPLRIAQTAGISATLNLYPNPVANGASALKLNGFTAGAYEVAVLSLNGQVLQQQQLNHPGGDKSINLATASLPAGMYFVRVTGGAGVWSAKLLVN